MSIDRLQAKVRQMKNPSVVGLDPKPDFIPDEILAEHITGDMQDMLAGLANAYAAFNKLVIDVIADIVPAVKPQSAYYEALGIAGIAALKQTIDYAKEKGMYVIFDGKRNDIGSTAEGYADAYLGAVSFRGKDYAAFDCDSMTINAYLGTDGVQPFLDCCRKNNKSAFALVKTSNPSGADFQNLLVGDRNLYTVVGDLLARLARDTVGESGFSCLGAVVGATYPSDMRFLRRRLEQTFFLVPGYGAQGGTAEDVAPAFNKYGHGAIVNSSRAILCAWKKDTSMTTKEATRAAALKMKSDISQHITVL